MKEIWLGFGREADFVGSFSCEHVRRSKKSFEVPFYLKYMEFLSYSNWSVKSRQVLGTSEHFQSKFGIELSYTTVLS
jgi:hypothetical protein